LFRWSEIDPIDSWRCGMTTEKITLPPAAILKGTDENSCIDFDVKGIKHVFCSTE